MSTAVEYPMASYELQESNVYSNDIQPVSSFVINMLHTSIYGRPNFNNTSIS